MKKDCVQPSFPLTFDDMVNASLEIIKSLKDKEPVNVAFSGGKDSIVIAELMRISGIKHQLIYHDTTIEPPDVRVFVKRYYPQVVITRPKKHYWHLLLEKLPPSRKYRWCCELLKHGQDKGNLTVLGIRAEESAKRKNYNIFEKEYRSKRIRVSPILHWPEWAVWEFIGQQGLKYPDIYNEVDRVGCVICPFRSYKMHQIWKRRYLAYYKTFEKFFVAWLAGKYDLKTYPIEDALDMWFRFYGVVPYEQLARIGRNELININDQDQLQGQGQTQELF